MAKKIILDTDPGHDDTFALLLAGASSAVDLVAVTTVAGNAEIEKTTTNALKICELGGMKDVPVFRGADGPLLREQVTALEIHGQSGLDGANLPVPNKPLAPGHAVDFMIKELMAAEDKITLVAVGPLTNVALALRKEPRLASKINEIVFMGGGYLGNTTPAAEFNMYADPEAAKIVLNSGVPLVMCELELTGQSQTTSEIRDEIREIGNPATTVAADILAYADQTYRKLFGAGDPEIHDAVAMAYCVDPTVFTTQKLRVDIETRGDYAYGMTVIDRYGKTGWTPNAKVGATLDTEKFWNIMFDAFRSYADTASEGGRGV